MKKWLGEVTVKHKEQRLRGNRKLALFIFTLIALTASLLLSGAMQKKTGTADDFIVVNGQRVSADEFGMYLDMSKALVADHFKQVYAADYSDRFWTDSFSGETPLRMLVAEARSRLIKAKVLQQLAEKVGIAADTSYESLLSGMEAENARRSKAVAAGEVVYGPISFELASYFSYYMSNLEIATTDALQKSGSLSISEEQVKREYEANKQVKYTQPGDIKLKWAALSYGEGTPFTNKNEALSVMQKLKDKAADPAAFDETASGLGIEVLDASVTKATRRTAALENPAVLQSAEKLQTGQLGDIFEENDALHLLYCISRGENLILPYGEAKDAIASQLRSDQFKQTVEQAQEEAVVEWNGKSAEKAALAWLGQ